VALCVERADPAELTRAGGDGLEAAARSARYEFLTRAAEQSGARYVATAHTADDQAETIMHRIVRGTGLVGLAGIPSARVLSPAVTLVRPILDFRRTEVLDYLRAIGQTFREDASNADVRWTRNRIRNELLPNLQRDYHRGAVDALLRLGRLAGEAQQVIDDCVDAASQRAVVSDDNDAIVFDVTQLAQLRPYLLREMLLRAWRHRGWPLQAMGLPQWEQLAAVATSDDAADDRPVKQVFPGGVAAENDGTRFALRRPDD